MKPPTILSFCCGVLLLSAALVRSQEDPRPTNQVPAPGQESPAHDMNSAVAPGEPVSVVNPKYPKKAHKQNVEGPVTLHVTIATDGSVKAAAIVSGDSRLTDAAIDAVRQWRFRPFTTDGKPVEGQREVTVNFSLHYHPSLPVGPIVKVGYAGVTAPTLTYGRNPEYSEAARRARLNGKVLLSLVVGPDGMPQDIKVTRPLGSGLDENAIDAVAQWRFRPGTKDGKPVAVAIDVEVMFQYY